MPKKSEQKSIVRFWIAAVLLGASLAPMPYGKGCAELKISNDPAPIDGSSRLGPEAVPTG